jgi:hypothetical protein
MSDPGALHHHPFIQQIDAQLPAENYGGRQPTCEPILRQALLLVVLV